MKKDQPLRRQISASIYDAIRATTKYHTIAAIRQFIFKLKTQTSINYWWHNMTQPMWTQQNFIKKQRKILITSRRFCASQSCRTRPALPSSSLIISINDAITLKTISTIPLLLYKTTVSISSNYLRKQNNPIQVKENVLIAMRSRRKYQVKIIRVFMHIEKHRTIITLRCRYCFDIRCRKMPAMDTLRMKDKTYASRSFGEWKLRIHVSSIKFIWYLMHF